MQDKHIAQEATSGVISKITQRPLKDQKIAYEEWLKEIIPVAQGFLGHKGVNIIRPHGTHDEYTILLHFESEARLSAWLNSKERSALIKKVRPILHQDEAIEIQTGLEFWFTPQEGHKATPPHKQFLITLSAIYPLTLIIPYMLSPLFESKNLPGDPFIRGFIVASIIVGLMTYIIMPRYVRLVATWLYK